MQYIVGPLVRVKVNNVQPKLTPSAKAPLIAWGKGESGRGQAPSNPSSNNFGISVAAKNGPQLRRVSIRSYVILITNTFEGKPHQLLIKSCKTIRTRFRSHILSVSREDQ